MAKKTKQEFEYKIGDNVFIQRKMVLGQNRRLSLLLKEIKLPTTIDIPEIIMSIGEHLPEFVANALSKKGEELTKDTFFEILEVVENQMEVEVGLQVVTDFFICNPIHSIVDKATTMISGCMTSFSEKQPKQK